MPDFQDNILCVTYDELVPKYYKTVISLSAILTRDEKRGYGMHRVVRGHYGSKSLIEYDSLPQNIKDEIPDLRKGIHPIERFFEIDKNAVEFYRSYRFWDGSSIDEEKQDIYIANASVLNAVYLLKEARITEILNKGHKPKKVWETLCNDVISFKPILEQKYESECDLPDNWRRFKEKAERYKETDYEYLIKKTHLNINAKKVNDETSNLFESMFARQNHKPTFVEVSETYEAFLDGYVDVINNATGELYNPKDFKKLSKATVYNYLSNWKSQIGTSQFREGNRQRLMQKFKTPHALERPKLPGSIISIDDRQPPFEYAKGKRVWFYMGIDLGSECYTTFVHGKTKEGIIADFYRQMVRNYAEWGLPVPAELECESSLNSSYRNTLLKEGNMFQYVRIEANNARGKRIERYFANLRYGNEKKMPGWIARPFAGSESNQEGTADVPLIPYETIVERCLREIEDWNNSPHSIHTDKTRWEVFCEMHNPNIKPTNWRGIVPHIGYETKTSCNVGIVKLQRGQYLLGDNGSIYTGEKLISLMTLVEGEELQVRWIDGNDGKVAKAYAYIDNKYMCELLSIPTYQKARIEQTEDDLRNRELMSSYVATTEAYAKRRKRSIEPITIIDNRQKTLNNKFKVRELATQPEYIHGDEVEVLEEIEFNHCLNIHSNGFKRQSLEERF